MGVLQEANGDAPMSLLAAFLYALYIVVAWHAIDRWAKWRARRRR